MKIEMGESLFYSWLRHVKECQLVQTNWKVSSQWNLSFAEELQQMMIILDKHYAEKFGYTIFKQNASLSQLLQQGECDVLGMSVQADSIKYYAVEVAFHEAGLNYGDRSVTVMKVLEKCARTALSLHGYFSTKKADIIFASPKINPAVLYDLLPCIDDMNAVFANHGYDFRFRIIANEEYDNLVLRPILLVSDGVADTSELFLRSYQMFKMFSQDQSVRKIKTTFPTKPNPGNTRGILDYLDADVYEELKIGQLAQRVLIPMLCNGCATEDEIIWMQTAEYSKQHFDLQYPLLKLATDSTRPQRYYADPIKIYGKYYYVCCEWFEKNNGNNDRPYLLKWIQDHKK